MKYIKLFENVSQSYEKVYRDDVNDVWEKLDIRSKFTSSELFKINKICSTAMYLPNPSSPNSFVQISVKKFFDIEHLSDYKFEIFKLIDEWFYISSVIYDRNLSPDKNLANLQRNKFANFCYKCDQFDGLIDCINNEIINR